MNIPGGDADGVMAGIDFMRQVNLHEKKTLSGKVVVIGGGVSKAGEVLVEGAKKGFLKYVFYPSTDVRFNLAVLGNDAGIIGAALLGKQED